MAEWIGRKQHSGREALVTTIKGTIRTITSLFSGRLVSVAVLAAATVTNTGLTTITGDLGLSPGTAVTGFPPGIVNGTVHAADSVALKAQTDLTTAYNDAAASPTTATIPVELGGTTETPGVYASPAGTFGITGTLRSSRLLTAT